MDQALKDCVQRLEKHNEALGVARNAFLAKDAEKHHFESALIVGALGGSNAEKTVNARASADWLQFHKELARLEAVYEFRKFEHEILNKTWQSEYLSLKVDSETIKKQE